MTIRDRAQTVWPALPHLTLALQEYVVRVRNGNREIRDV